MHQDPECLFCKIVNKEIPSEVVFEDDKVVAFKDIDPQAPVHIVIVPKEHFNNIIEAQDNNDYLNGLLNAAVKVAKDQNLDDGFRLVINTGKEGGQTVEHLHLHLLGGRNMQWPPG